MKCIIITFKNSNFNGFTNINKIINILDIPVTNFRYMY